MYNIREERFDASAGNIDQGDDAPASGDPGSTKERRVMFCTLAYFLALRMHSNNGHLPDLL